MKLMHVMVCAGFIVVAGAMSACSSATPEPNPQPLATTPRPAGTSAPIITPTSKVPPQVFTPTPAAKDLLLAALNSATSKIKTYRVRVPEEGRLMEIVLPDKVRQVENEPITKIASTYWQISSTGEKRAQQVGAVPFMDRPNLLWLRDQISKSTQSAFLGPAILDGVQCIGYSINVPLLRISPPKSPGATPEVTELSETVKIWFDTTDGLPRRIEYGAPLSVTVNFFDYNANIEINPP